jgi:hypothetical protein
LAADPACQSAPFQLDKETSMIDHHRPDAVARDILTRGLAIVGLLGVALIHLLDAIPTFSELPYKGWLYVGLILGAVIAAGMLVRGGSRLVWAGVVGLAVAAAVGFVYSRTVGLPGAADDIGNWSEPLGVAALFVEAAVLAIAGYALACLARAPSPLAHRPTDRTSTPARAA